jgi:hypothetical protein
MDGGRCAGPGEEAMMTQRLLAWEGRGSLAPALKAAVEEAADLELRAAARAREKGMNIALQDAGELTQGILGLYRSGDGARLDAYSGTRLPQVWRAVEFSYWMLQLLLADGSGTAAASFHEGLRDARLRRLMDDAPFARAFALAYVGPDR